MEDIDTSCTNCIHQGVCYIQEEVNKVFTEDKKVSTAIVDLDLYTFLAEYCQYFEVRLE